MSEAIERLILALAAQARPVRRLAPPLRRATLWLVAVAVLSCAAILLFADLVVFTARARDPRMMVELAGTLLTGITATIAAFYLSLPDRSPGWALLPLPPLLLWLASSGYGCYRHWLSFGPEGWEIGESANCFRFILVVSLPLGASLLFLLRRAYPLWPVRVAALGGLGVAGIAAFLLQFFHPFDVTVMDLAVHVAAVALVVLVCSGLGSWSRRHAF
jgi:hypothetical protein